MEAGLEFGICHFIPMEDPKFMLLAADAILEDVRKQEAKEVNEFEV